MAMRRPLVYEAAYGSPAERLIRLEKRSLTSAEWEKQAAAVRSVSVEEVTGYRELAAADAGRYRPRLADSLANLGISFWIAGSPAQALPAGDAKSFTEEAVGIYRDLAAADPGRYRPRLANSLANLGIGLWDLGMPADALPVTEEAISLYRELAAGDSSKYRFYLASSLMTFGYQLWHLGYFADSLPVTEEAVSLYRELAVANPKDNLFRDHLIRTQFNLALTLAKLEHYSAALQVLSEADESAARLIVAMIRSSGVRPGHQRGT